MARVVKAPDDHSELVNITRPMDNTAMNAYMACPREFRNSMIDHRRGKGKGAALVYGSAWHKALEVHYKTNGDALIVEMAVRQSWEEHGDTSDYRTVERVLLDYKAYVKKFGPPDKENAQTVGYPSEPLIELSTNAAGGGLKHPWAGKLDRIINVGGLIYIEDHKTTSRLDKHYFKQFDLSNQMMGYTFLGRQLLPNMNVRGVRMNVAHVLKGGTEFYRQLFDFSPERIAEWVENTNELMQRVDHDYYLLNNKLPGAFPGHYGDNGCSRKFGMCQYHTVCSLSPRLRQRELEMAFDINEWNPLEADDE